MNRLLTILVTVSASALLLLQTGCSLSKRMDSARQDLMKEYQAMPEWNTLPQKRISWQQAVAMLENNVEMQQARLRINKTRRECERVYRDLIPLLDLGYYYNSALLKSADNYSTNSSFNVNTIFSIPALTQLPMDHYCRALEHFKAEKELELKRRELLAKLWQYFNEGLLEEQLRAMEEATPANQAADLQLRNRERELRERERSQKISQLLNNYSARWILMPETAPKINWQQYRKLAKVPDELTQTQMALTLEAARLSKLGVGLQYLPNVHLNFYSPALFSVTGGTTEGFLNGADDVRINLNIYSQIDTRLDIWSQWAEAEENHKLVEQELTQQMYEYRNKMELLLDSWKTYDDWMHSTQAYIAFRRSQGACDAQSVQEIHQEDLALQKELLDQAKKNLERECALIQEYGIPGYSN
ncbi:MAG: hypothetical protein Q4F40_05105 [Akkermansia sp.]|nr:hypothetical protein [Akkermansia sp.]